MMLRRLMGVGVACAEWAHCSVLFSQGKLLLLCAQHSQHLTECVCAAIDLGT